MEVRIYSTWIDSVIQEVITTESHLLDFVVFGFEQRAFRQNTWKCKELPLQLKQVTFK
jgi:hypothetical protein